MSDAVNELVKRHFSPLRHDVTIASWILNDFAGNSRQNVTSIVATACDVDVTNLIIHRNVFTFHTQHFAKLDKVIPLYSMALYERRRADVAVPMKRCGPLAIIRDL